MRGTQYPQILRHGVGGRIDAIKIYELGEIYTAEDVLKLLDFLLNAYREERGER